MKWELKRFRLRHTDFANLIKKLTAGELDNSRAKDVFQVLLEKDLDPAVVMKELGIEAVDDSALESICEELLAMNPQVVEDFQAGKKQAIGSLIGQAKKKNPNANPGKVRELLIAIIEKKL